jgi:hypothetical protein
LISLVNNLTFDPPPPPLPLVASTTASIITPHETYLLPFLIPLFQIKKYNHS